MDNSYEQISTRLLEKVQLMYRKPSLDSNIYGILDQCVKNVERQSVYLENGIINFNFCEIGMVLEYVTLIYGKKVDLLWELLLNHQKNLAKFNIEDSRRAQEEKLIEERREKFKRKRKKPPERTIEIEEPSFDINSLIPQLSVIYDFEQIFSLEHDDWEYDNQLPKDTEEDTNDCYTRSFFVPTKYPIYLNNEYFCDNNQILTDYHEFEVSDCMQQAQFNNLSETDVNGYKVKDELLQEYLVDRRVTCCNITGHETSELHTYIKDELVNKLPLIQKCQRLCPRRSSIKLTRLSKDVVQKYLKDRLSTDEMSVASTSFTSSDSRMSVANTSFFSNDSGFFEIDLSEDSTSAEQEGNNASNSNLNALSVGSSNENNSDADTSHIKNHNCNSNNDVNHEKNDNSNNNANQEKNDNSNSNASLEKNDNFNSNASQQKNDNSSSNTNHIKNDNSNSDTNHEKSDNFNSDVSQKKNEISNSDVNNMNNDNNSSTNDTNLIDRKSNFKNSCPINVNNSNKESKKTDKKQNSILDKRRKRKSETNRTEVSRKRSCKEFKSSRKLRKIITRSLREFELFYYQNYKPEINEGEIMIPDYLQGVCIEQTKVLALQKVLTRSLKEFELFYYKNYKPQIDEGIAIEPVFTDDLLQDNSDLSTDDQVLLLQDSTDENILTVVVITDSNIDINISENNNKASSSGDDIQRSDKNGHVNINDNESNVSINNTVDNVSHVCVNNTADNVSKLQQTKDDITEILKERQLLREKVGKWKEQINKRLAATEKSDFDIHQYETRLLDMIPNEEPFKINKVMDGKKAPEIARLFVASLQLVNNSNIELINKTPGQVANDTLEFRVINRDRHHEHLETYQAPSLEARIEALKRIRTLQERQNVTTPAELSGTIPCKKRRLS